MKAYIQLEDGSLFEGQAFGYQGQDTVVGELTYNTSMNGQQEVLTDPAYRGQLLIFTYPLLGSYGFNLEDEESEDMQVAGIVCREKVDHPNNFRYEMNVDDYLNYHKIPGITGVDTRALTRYLLENGPMKGVITKKPKTESELKAMIDDLDLKNSIFQVTTPEEVHYEGQGKSVAIWDFGLRRSLLDFFQLRGCSVTLYPAQTNYERILDKGHDLLILSSGPGNPSMAQDIIADIEQLLGKIDLVGIGLGAQLLARALGCGIQKVAGHKGYEPILDKETGEIKASYQNYSYGLTDEKKIVRTFENLRDGTTAGFKAKDYPAWGYLFQAEENPKEGHLNYILEERIGG